MAEKIVTSEDSSAEPPKKVPYQVEIWPGIVQTPREVTKEWYIEALRMAASGEIDQLLQKARALRTG